ncbi:PadR family transcriptional regulator [Alkalibaculum sp. M08DMB]|uniref:PadR family transcriptional regulator n=1 Tax=Alkalibaculum sporogenes TaxID=2655001 RepID=A0A6A7K8L0_9FIRM|nr:PadR family transcriptional regulator [Alkalibaculum sporogenes]MPW25808.1 PadR family transcriptional regulator [Alkalibaculum sporogenes]
MPIRKGRNRNALFKISMTALVKLLILNMLSEKELYGNKIIDNISLILNEQWAPSPGMIYPLLRQLEDEGYIIGRWSDPVKRSTRYYKITEEGTRYLPILKKNYHGPINDSIRMLESLMVSIYS